MGPGPFAAAAGAAIAARASVAAKSLRRGRLKSAATIAPNSARTGRSSWKLTESFWTFNEIVALTRRLRGVRSHLWWGSKTPSFRSVGFGFFPWYVRCLRTDAHTLRTGRERLGRGESGHPGCALAVRPFRARQRAAPARLSGSVKAHEPGHRAARRGRARQRPACPPPLGRPAAMGLGAARPRDGCIDARVGGSVRRGLGPRRRDPDRVGLGGRAPLHHAPCPQP